MTRDTDPYRRLLRFGFQLLYSRLAFAYDTISWIVSAGKWRCWQLTALSHLPAERETAILELAFGTGILQEELLKAGYRPAGLDLSRQMNHIARKRLHRNGYPLKLVRARAEQLPFASYTFDVVVSTFPTDFILADDTLREVRRVLRKDGHLIVVLNGILSDQRPDAKALEWLYRITGQRDQNNGSIGALLARFGFVTTLIHERCPRSLAQVIIAVKSA